MVGVPDAGFSYDSAIPGSMLLEKDKMNPYRMQGNRSIWDKVSGSNQYGFSNMEMPAECDGKFSIFQATKNLGKGVVKFFTDTVKTAIEHPIKTIVAVAAIAAVCAFVPFAAPVLASICAVAAAFKTAGVVGNIAYNLATGNNDEAEKCFVDLGSATTETALSVFAFSKAVKATNIAKATKGASAVEGASATTSAVENNASSIAKDAIREARGSFAVGNSTSLSGITNIFKASWGYLKGGWKNGEWNASKAANLYKEGLSEDLLTQVGKWKEASSQAANAGKVYKLSVDEINGVEAFANGLKEINVPNVKLGTPKISLDTAKAVGTNLARTARKNSLVTTLWTREDDISYLPAAFQNSMEAYQ